jgi:hypothetical protein
VILRAPWRANPKAFREFDQKRPGDFLSKGAGTLIDGALSVHDRCRILNKIEEYKKEKDGLDILPDVPRYAAKGWKAITNALIVVDEVVRLGRELHWFSENVIDDRSEL